MASIKRMQKRYAKTQLEKALAGGDDFVSDVKKQQLEAEKVQAAEQFAGAQQGMINRAAQARGERGPVLAGQQQAQTAALAQGAGRAGVAAAGQTQAQVQQMRDAQRQAALEYSTSVRSQNQQDVANAIAGANVATSAALGGLDFLFSDSE